MVSSSTAALRSRPSSPSSPPAPGLSPLPTAVAGRRPLARADCAISGNCEVIRGCGHSRRRSGEGEATGGQRNRKGRVDSTKGRSFLIHDDGCFIAIDFSKAKEEKKMQKKIYDGRQLYQKDRVLRGSTGLANMFQ